MVINRMRYIDKECLNAIFITLGIRLVKTTSAWNMALIRDQNNETPSQLNRFAQSHSRTSEFSVQQFESDETRLISSFFY